MSIRNPSIYEIGGRGKRSFCSQISVVLPLHLNHFFCRFFIFKTTTVKFNHFVDWQLVDARACFGRKPLRSAAPLSYWKKYWYRRKLVCFFLVWCQFLSGVSDCRTSWEAFGKCWLLRSVKTQHTVLKYTVVWKAENSTWVTTLQTEYFVGGSTEEPMVEVLVLTQKHSKIDLISETRLSCFFYSDF